MIDCLYIMTNCVLEFVVEQHCARLQDNCMVAYCVQKAIKNRLQSQLDKVYITLSSNICAVDKYLFGRSLIFLKQNRPTKRRL